MLFIKSLKFTNLGRHKKIAANITGHVPGLAGPNGKGKTTIIQGVQFAFTGTIDHPDPLRAFIRRTSEPKPPKFMEVECEFVADGKEGRIIRRVTPTTSTRKLWWDGAKKPVTSEKKVSGILFDILGVDKKAINSTVFIRQGEMAAMFGKDTERRDFYTRLLMLGHLEKIGQVVETHRSHIADSVQDLSAVRDQADKDSLEASEYFEQCVEDLKKKKSYESEIEVVRGVMKQFEAAVEAERDLELAERKLANEIGQDAGDPQAWITRSKKDLVDAQERVEELSQRRAAHMKAAQEKRDADDAKRRARELTDQFLAMHETEAALAKQGELGENPGPKLERTRELVRKFDEHETLAKEIPAKRSALGIAEKLDTELSAQATGLQGFYDKAREEYRAEKSEIDMRKKIRDELLKDITGDIESCGCPVCGSASPDPKYLDRTIEEGEIQLAKLQEKGSKLQSDLQNVKDRWENSSREVKKLTLEIEQMTEREASLRMDLLMVGDRAALEGKIEKLLKDQQAYAAKEYEVNRLEKQLKEQRQKLEPFRLPSEAEIEHLEDRVRITTQELAAASWSDSDDEAESTFKKLARDLRSSLGAVQDAVTSLTDARKREEDRTVTLSRAIEETDDYWGDYTKPLTMENVKESLESFEKAQQEHDEARGRKDAANQALKNANRKLDELDLRVEEQKGRLKLGEDLARIRDTFKPNGASLEYLDYKFEQIARLAADYLAESGADFMVAASDDTALAFDFLRTDRDGEVWMPQNRMSGGQKVRLAVATLRAIHALIMPNVGLLVLDEPTTHLDEEAKRSMADMLKRIGDEGTLQILVCDHSPTLIDAFSDVITIPE